MARNALAISILFLLVSIFGCTNQTLSKDEFYSRFAEVRSTPGTQISDQGDYIIVMIPNELQLIAFTKSDHAAYPGIIEYTIVSDNGKVSLKSYGNAGGDHREFEQFQARLNLKVLEMAMGLVSDDT
jgi:hypothetical protein